MERIVHIQMDIEKRLLLHRIKGPVELHIVLRLQVGGFPGPQRLHLVDDIVLVSIDILAVLPFLLFPENHRDWHELAVFVKKSLDPAFRGELGILVIYIKGDLGTPVSPVAVRHLIFRAAVAGPSYSLGPFLP